MTAVRRRRAPAQPTEDDESARTVREEMTAAGHPPHDTDPSPPPAIDVPDPSEQIGVVRHNGAGFDRIVARVFDLADPESLYDRLEKDLKLGEQRADYGALVKGLDEAEDSAREAHRLWLNGKDALEEAERESRRLQAPMRAEASDQLQQEKDKGARSKQITDADVTSRAIELYPDLYDANERKVSRLKGAVEQMGQLSKLWSQRCTTLATLLANRRR